MVLWFVFALMTALLLAAVLRPLLRERAQSDLQVVESEAGLAVYRDQLREIEADQERGLIAAAEAESAKTEVARRLLGQAKEAGLEQGNSAKKSWANIVSYAAAAAIPLIAISTYLIIGAPSLPDAPLEARKSVPADKASVAELIGKVEQRLASDPGDGKGWAVIAPVYMRIGRFDEAAIAFQKANTILGEDVRFVLGFAQARMLANNGLVTDEVQSAYRRVKQIDPTNTEAEFGLALAKEQNGDLKGARDDYQAMLAAAPENAKWKEPLVQRIKALEERLGDKGQSAQQPAAKRPTADAIAKLPAEDRAKAIEAMVQQLANRLKSDGKNLSDWKRLIRAYAVLGQKQNFEEAVRDARQNFADNAAALGEIDALSQTLRQGS